MSSVPFFERPSNFWIRWVFLLPISFVCASLASPISKILFEVIPSLMFSLSDFYIRYSIPFISGVLSGSIFVSVATAVAPTHNRNVSVIFMVLFIIISLAVMVSGYNHNPMYSSNAESIGQIVGSIYAFKSVSENISNNPDKDEDIF